MQMMITVSSIRPRELLRFYRRPPAQFIEEIQQENQMARWLLGSFRWHQRDDAVAARRRIVAPCASEGCLPFFRPDARACPQRTNLPAPYRGRP